MTAPERRGPERPGPDYPPEWDLEPPDEREHDEWHPAFVDGCDMCADLAVWLETRPERP